MRGISDVTPRDVFTANTVKLSHGREHAEVVP